MSSGVWILWTFVNVLSMSIPYICLASGHVRSIIPSQLLQLSLATTVLIRVWGFQGGPRDQAESSHVARLGFHYWLRASLVTQTVKNLPAMQDTWVWSLGREGPLEKRTATHSSILAWRIPWTEESVRLQSMKLQRVRHDWETNTFTFYIAI